MYGIKKGIIGNIENPTVINNQSQYKNKDIKNSNDELPNLHNKNTTKKEVSNKVQELNLDKIDDIKKDSEKEKNSKEENSRVTISNTTNKDLVKIISPTNEDKKQDNTKFSRNEAGQNTTQNIKETNESSINKEVIDILNNPKESDALKVKFNTKNKDDLADFDKNFDNVHKSISKKHDSDNKELPIAHLNEVSTKSLNKIEKPNNPLIENSQKENNLEKTTEKKELNSKLENNDAYDSKKDDEYNFDDAITGNLQDNFKDNLKDNDLKNTPTKDEKKVNNEIEYDYDDFIVENPDNLFPKKKNK